MIELNNQTGHIFIDSLIVSPELSESKFLDLVQLPIEIIKVNQHDDYTLYLIKNIDAGEYSVSLLFHKSKILTLNIGLGNRYSFPAFIITDEEKHELSKKLESIGGANSYRWGSIELNEDRKGGILSILIEYKTVPI